MLTEREWSQYSRKRAPLRVTIPDTGQRSTYFLQLPFLWSTPLLIGSALLHWFISQGIFLMRIALYDHGSKIDKTTFDGVESQLGYSDRGILASLLLGLSLVLIVLFVALVFKYPSGPPLGASCSAVISAACHVGTGEGNYSREGAGEDIANKPLMWGVTVQGSRMVPGHCAFSAEMVTEPIKGYLYK